MHRTLQARLAFMFTLLFVMSTLLSPISMPAASTLAAPKDANVVHCTDADVALRREQNDSIVRSYASSISFFGNMLLL